MFLFFKSSFESKLSCQRNEKSLATLFLNPVKNIRISWLYRNLSVCCGKKTNNTTQTQQITLCPTKHIKAAETKFPLTNRENYTKSNENAAAEYTHRYKNRKKKDRKITERWINGKTARNMRKGQKLVPKEKD